MSPRPVAFVFVTVCLIGCGGAVDPGDGNAGGASTGGSAGASTGGQSNAGTGGVLYGGYGGTGAFGGVTFGGSGGVGAGAGTAGAGTGATAGSAGGTGYDPRCPPATPARTLSSSDAADRIIIPSSCMPLGLTCTYDAFSGCLCMQNAKYGCMLVDPACSPRQSQSADPPAGAAIPRPQPANTSCTCTQTGWMCAPAL